MAPSSKQEEGDIELHGMAYSVQHLEHHMAAREKWSSGDDLVAKSKTIGGIQGPT